MSQPNRLARGGRLDRSRELSFTFNGKTYRGHPGDTLASALLANGVDIVNRSFKYSRPRGIVAAGAEEPNAVVQLGSTEAARCPTCVPRNRRSSMAWRHAAPTAGPMCSAT